MNNGSEMTFLLFFIASIILVVWLLYFRARAHKRRYFEALRKLGLSPELKDLSDQQIRELARMGFKLQAILAYRNRTRKALRDSKWAVDRLLRGEDPE